VASLEYGSDLNTMYLRNKSSSEFYEFIVTKVRDRFFITASKTSIDPHYSQKIMTFEMEKDTEGYKTLLLDLDKVFVAENESDVMPIFAKMKNLID
jgi:hypothetical protein